MNKTAKYKTDNIIPYLYVAMDEVSVLTGSVKQQEFIRAAMSGNTLDATNLLKETPQLIESVILYLQQEDDVEDLINLMKTALYDMNYIEEKDRRRIATNIAERADEIANNWDVSEEIGLNFEELLDGYLICENQSEYKKLLNQCLITENEEYSLEKLNAFARCINQLEQDTIRLLHNCIRGILEHDYISMKEFVDVKVEYGLYDKVWIEQYYKYLIRHIGKTKSHSNQLIEELRDSFSKLVAPKGINYCFKELKPLFSFEKLTSVFREFIQNEKSQTIDVNVLEELICQQIETYSSASDYIATSELSLLINSIKCEFSTETATILDKYFVSVIGKDDVGELLRNFSKNNDISLIDNSIKETIKWIFTTPYKEKDKCLDDIMQSVDAKKKTDILDKIKRASEVTSGNIYEHLDELVISYAENAWDEIHSYLVSLPKNFSNIYANDDYVKFVSRCYVGVSERLTEQELELYVDALINKIKANKCVESCVEAVCSISKYISDKKFLIIEPTIYEKVNETNCQEIYRAFEHHLNQFTKENNNSKHLIDVCFLVIENTNLHNQAIQLLNRHFLNISRVQRLVELVENVAGVEKEKAYKVVKKFLVGKNISIATTDILSILSKFGIDVVNAILDDSKTEMSMKMAEQITQQIDKVSVEELLHYIAWIVGLENELFNETINKMIQLAIDVCDTEEQYKRIVEIMENMSRTQYKGYSKMYITPIVNMLRKITSRELRKRLLERAKEIRIHKTVMEQLPKELQET